MRNRERLLHEAEVLFGEVGVTAPLDELARRAEVSSATLYRHFPTREGLLSALEDRLEARLGDVVKNLAGSTPGGKIETLILDLASVLVEYPASRAIMIALRRRDPASVWGDRVRPFIEQLTTDAQEEGTLRRDVTADDVMTCAVMIGSLGPFSPEPAPAVWRRHAEIVLDGLGLRSARA